MLILNLRGVLMLVASFAPALACGHFLGIENEGLLMMIAGPLLAIFDLGYRTQSQNGRLLQRDGGGTLLFLPIWYFGIYWTILGLVYTIKGES